MLTSAVCDIQPFPQLQCARNEQCVSNAYLRRYLKEHREGVPKGEWKTIQQSFVNAASEHQVCPVLEVFRSPVVCAETCARQGSGRSPCWRSEVCTRHEL